MTTQEKKSVKFKQNDRLDTDDDLIREYKKTRWVVNSERICKPDSLSAWYSIEEMEEFIALARLNGGDGIRFYFAAYPEVCVSKPEFAGRQTLLKVATRSKITTDGLVVNKDVYRSKNGALKILSGGRPSLCPPNCIPNYEGGTGGLGITLVDRGKKGFEIV